MKLGRWLWMIGLLLFTSCSPTPPPPPPPTPTPVPGTPPPTPPPHGRFLKRAEVLAGQNAIGLEEISLLVRSHTPDAEVLAELSTRSLIQPIDVASAKRLEAEGASPRLIAALTSYDYVLADADKPLFKQRPPSQRQVANQATTGKSVRAEEEIARRAEARRQQDEERDAAVRKLAIETTGSVQRVMQNALDQQVAAYDKAIDEQSRRVNWYKNHNYTETEIKQATERLEALKQARAKLKPLPPPVPPASPK